MHHTPGVVDGSRSAAPQWLADDLEPLEVNDRHWDSDTVGAIACAFGGALNEKARIPQEYLAELEFRDELEQAGQALLDRAIV